MTYNAVPPPSAADSTGVSDSQWITDVRDGLEDYPRKKIETWTADGTNGPVSVSSAPLSVLNPPLYGDAATNPPLVRDNTTATNYTVVDFPTAPTAGQVQVNYDTGELTFNSAPALNDVIQVEYQSVRWRDTSILTGLYAGLRAMFPRVFKTYVDTSIQIQTNVWDYQLPAFFADPRSRIFSVEIADPYIITEPFKPLRAGARRVGFSILHIPFSQRYSPVARLRVTGQGPYLRLGDLEPQLYHLPVWYALGVLLPKKEAKRVREDTLVPLTQAGGQQPGLQVQTGDYYARRFEQELERLSRTMGPGPILPMGTVYDFRSY